MKAKYISDNLAALQVELSKHKELQQECKACETFGEVLAFLAAQVGLALDGAYTEQDIDNIAGIIVKRLEKERSPILLLEDVRAERKRG